MQIKFAALAFALSAPLFGQQMAEDSPPKLDLVETAQAAGQFETLLAAAEAAGLVETLRGDGPLTLFAPTDAAFEALPEGAVDALLADPDKLAMVLKYHVVAGAVPAAKVVTMDWAATVQGQSLRVVTADGVVHIDDATVIKADVQAKNGVIHVIDKVMLPRPNIVELAMEAGDFDSLCSCVKAAGLVETLSEGGPFTVFAPADSAFAKLPKETVDGLLHDSPRLAAVLTYHVIPGRVLAGDIPVAKGDASSVRPKTVQGAELDIRRDAEGQVTVNGARVIKSDIIAGNGVIHVIDAVVLPPAE